MCGFCLAVDGWYFGFVLDSVKKDEKKMAAMLVAIISERNSTIKNCAIVAGFISEQAEKKKEMHLSIKILVIYKITNSTISIVIVVSTLRKTDYSLNWKYKIY